MANAYAQAQNISLESESAYEELYSRLARWTEEAVQFYQVASEAEADYRVERCIELLGYMDRGIDLGGTADVVKAILSLHRFGISTLVRARADHNSDELKKLVKVFLAMGEIFVALRERRMAN